MKYECPSCGWTKESHPYYSSVACRNDDCRVNAFETDRSGTPYSRDAEQRVEEGMGR